MNSNNEGLLNEELINDYTKYEDCDITSERKELEATIAHAQARLQELTDEEMQNTEGGCTYDITTTIHARRYSNRVCIDFDKGVKLKRCISTSHGLTAYRTTR